MATYNVVFEIEVDADNQLEAAKTVQKWIKESKNDWQYYVQNAVTMEITEVDLAETEASNAIVPAQDYQPLIKK